MPDYSMLRARRLLSEADVPLLIYAGPIKPEWTEAASAKGFTLIARIRDHQHMALQCNACRGITVECR